MTLAGTVRRVGGVPSRSSRDYGRLFDNLPAWEPQGGGDAIERLWQMAEAVYTDRQRDNAAIPAGYTYFAQLVNHDVTFDAGNSRGEQNVPLRSRNLRTPRLDLDCVYGRGPLDQPYLYDGDGSGRLALGRNHRGETDLLRSPLATDGKSDISINPFNWRRPALIGDPRNDENVLVAQLHVALCCFHNRLIDAGHPFATARRLTRWHYQWVVLHDLLPRLCGARLVTEVLGARGRPELRLFGPRLDGCIPVEFSAAAYRIGHAMVRSSYALNEALLAGRGGPLPIFAAIAEDGLAGGRVLPPRWSVQWDLFVETPDGGVAPQPSQALRPEVSRPLRALPMPGAPPRDRSLIFRTLLRGWQLGLPAGQAVARRLMEPVLDGTDPLWIYILREAGAHTGGAHLGPVGGRIVAEVLVGLLAADPGSFLSQEPGWTPRPEGGAFRLGALLDQAGVATSRERWEARCG